MSMKKMLAVVAAASLVAVAAPAFAANPFSDVPLNHWAYDAVENLAAKGILEGYPDNTFRGKKAMTRYEIATMVARMMANENLGNEDIEQLKALVVEFGPELEALGVKVDSFDSRLAALEKGLGGWKITGQMRFDYKAYDYDGDAEALDSGNRRDGFEMNRGRIFLHRDLAQGVSFDMRWHRDNIDRYWVTAKDFMGVEGLQVRLGSFNVDWDGDDDMYTAAMSGGDAWITDCTYKGAEIKYSNGSIEVVGLAASDNAGHNGDKMGVYAANESSDIYGGRIKASFGDKVWLSLNVLGQSFDSQTDGSPEASYITYWANLGFKVTPGIEIKGSYFAQDWEDEVIETLNDGSTEDSPSAYRVILDIDQSVLKFTSIWAQYSHYDAGFAVDNMDYTFETKDYTCDNIYDTAENLGENGATGKQVFLTDHDVIFAYLKQQWTPKVSTFEEFQYADADDASDATRWAVGVGYQYSPALYFELAYSMQDGHCDVEKDASGYEDNILRFRTLFNF